MSCNSYLYSSDSRAAIIASKTINMWLDPDLSDRDTATCQFKANDGELIRIASVYCDINKPVSSYSQLSKLTSKSNVVIGSDTNAHSELWGSDSSNKRGEDFEDLIATRSLAVHNIGSAPTFIGRGTETIIDVTLSSADIEDKISNWRVRPDRSVRSHSPVGYFVLDIRRG